MNKQVKEQIRAEIERRLQRENEILWNAKKRGTYPSPSCEYNLLTLTSLRDFIDSLPDEQPSENIVDAYRKWVESHNDGDVLYCKKAFIAGAQWQKKQDTADMLKSDFTVFNKCYEQGKEDMKEQMLKDAVECELYRDGDFFASIDIDMATLGYTEKDKVKIIIVKEE